MNTTKRLLTFLLVLMLSLGAMALAGCNEKDADQKSSKATTTTTTEAKEEINANWTIEIDDKLSVEQEGLPIDYTLAVTATKAGGTDPTGSYKGTAHMTMKADFSKFKGLPQSVVKVMGSADGAADDKNLTFKVITFKEAREGAAKAGRGSDDDPSALAPLVPEDKAGKTTNTIPEPTEEDKQVANPDFYSYGYMTMKGTGSLNMEAKGIGGEHAQYSDEKTASDRVGFSMNIVGATVYIDIPKAGRFKGTVTGDPIE